MPSLRTLDHQFRPMAEAFFRYASAAYPGLVVTSARRTHQEQARLYASAQRGENDGLPAMPPGTSDHEVGLAFDMARPGVHPLSDDVLAALGPQWIAWGGRWTSRDPVHFAAPVGRALRQAARGSFVPNRARRTGHAVAGRDRRHHRWLRARRSGHSR